MRSRCLGYVDPAGFLNMPLVRHEEESDYVLWLVALLGPADEIKGSMGLNACCLDRPYD